MCGQIRVMRILGRLNIGGPALHVITIGNELEERGITAALVCGPGRLDEGSMIPEAISRNIRVRVLPEIMTEMRPRMRDVFALWKLCRIIREEQPHIVETHTSKAGFLGRLAARIAGVPIIIHTYHGHVLDGYYGRIVNWGLRNVERSLAGITDCVVAVSEQVKQDLVRYQVAPAEKITVIRVGVDLGEYARCEIHRGEFRAELGFNETHRLVGIMGRLFPIKNHRLFLQAAAIVAAEISDVSFVIVGDGALRRELENYALKLGIGRRVIFTGWRKDQPRIYADLDVLALSSINEGTPLSVIEGMASGCPVVATRVGGVPDLIRHEENGWLVDASDSEALARGIIGVLQQPERAKRVAARARSDVLRIHAKKRLLDDIESLYGGLLNRRKICRIALPQVPNSREETNCGSSC